MKNPLRLLNEVVVPVQSLRTCAWEPVVGPKTPEFLSGEEVSHLRDEVLGFGGSVVELCKQLSESEDAVAI